MINKIINVFHKRAGPPSERDPQASGTPKRTGHLYQPIKTTTAIPQPQHWWYVTVNLILILKCFLARYYLYVYYDQFYYIVHSVFYVFCLITCDPLENADPALTAVQHLSETLDPIHLIEKELLYILHVFFWPYDVD